MTMVRPKIKRIDDQKKILESDWTGGKHDQTQPELAV